MTAEHPLTSHIINEELLDDQDELLHRTCFPQSYYEEDFRLGADWQLEQDQKELKYFLEEFSCRGHSADAVLDLRAFVNNFQNIMRPTTQENN